MPNKKKKQRKRNTMAGQTRRGAIHRPPMQIIKGLPPNYGQIAKAFDLSGHEIFCYGNYIYNPTGEQLSIELIEHEKVHREQQGDDPDAWWDMFIESAEFRFDQELEAHIKEYRVYCLRHRFSKDRRKYLEWIGERMSSPTYGGMVTKEEAMQRVHEGRKNK